MTTQFKIEQQFWSNFTKATKGKIVMIVGADEYLEKMKDRKPTSHPDLDRIGLTSNVIEETIYILSSD